MNIRFPTLDILVGAAVVASGLVGLGLLYWLLGGSRIVITNNPDGEGIPSAISGLPCARASRRPVAVMLASDAEARPLSGIGQADMVFEMPVTPNGITRMMAVYQCNEPKEIGSIRSARYDFIPLAQGLDALLVHWGGEKDALDALNGGIIDNIDALKYEGSTFFRKSSLPRPHNGFTTSALLGQRTESLGYRATTSLDPYAHLTRRMDRSIGSLEDTLRVSWPQNMDVTFRYDAATNTYLRFRGGLPEMDVATNAQVRASTIVRVDTTASFLHDQYIRVDTVGNGVATIWQEGRRINARWKKTRPTDMLQFTDAGGVPIALTVGTVWVLIDAPLPAPN